MGNCTSDHLWISSCHFSIDARLVKHRTNKTDSPVNSSAGNLNSCSVLIIGLWAFSLIIVLPLSGDIDSLFWMADCTGLLIAWDIVSGLNPALNF